MANQKNIDNDSTVPPFEEKGATPLFPPSGERGIGLKICGMKYPENIQQVAALQPDYLGFIFYKKSKRNFEGSIPKLPKSIKKTGVFVNEHLEIVASLVKEYQLEAIQLHGDESVEYIIKFKELLHKSKFDSASYNEMLKQVQHKKKNLNQVQVIKVFSIKNEFNFDVLKPYLEVVDYFLFDTKGKERGGNGTKFDWSVLKKYPYEKPFFLSGGIGVNDVDKVKEILHSDLPIYAIDVNSKFESEPGVKKIEELKKFKEKVITNLSADRQTK